jgi:hypothetical protein
MQTRVTDNEIALQRAIQSIDDPGDRETSMAMHVLLAANVVGADVFRLSERTGYEVDEIRKFETNLREAGLWIGEFADDLEWQGKDEHQMMYVLFVHAAVACGLLQRRLEEGFAIYLDHAGHEEARFRYRRDSSV